MPLSMTGFGSAEVAHDDGSAIRIEVKTVNSRFLEVRWHAPSELQSLLPDLEKQIRTVLKRGRVDVFASWIGSAASAASVDEAMAERWCRVAERLAERCGLPQNLGVVELLALPGVVARPQPLAYGAEIDPEQVRKALEVALQGVCLMRANEGATGARDLSERVAAVRRGADAVGAMLPDVVRRRLERSKARLAELVEGPFDADRLHQEAALLADRLDVQEEVERLRSHCEQFTELLSTEGPVGRKMDFLVQEMNREVSTIGSKLADASEMVVELKAELERIREQVQNLE